MTSRVGDIFPFGFVSDMTRRGVTRRVSSCSLFLQSFDVGNACVDRPRGDEPFFEVVGGWQFLRVEGARLAVAHELAAGDEHAGGGNSRLQLRQSHRVKLVSL